VVGQALSGDWVVLVRAFEGVARAVPGPELAGIIRFDQQIEMVASASLIGVGSGYGMMQKHDSTGPICGWGEHGLDRVELRINPKLLYRDVVFAVYLSLRLVFNVF